MRAAYRHPESTQTLREGLAEYYAVNPGLLEPDTVENEALAHYLRCHDATHVFFGTDIDPYGEVVNDLLTLMAVDVSFYRYVFDFLAIPEGKELFKDVYANTSTIGLLLHTLRMFPTVWRRARAMQRRWPWAPPEHVYDRRLVDLRQEFGFQGMWSNRGKSNRGQDDSCDI